MASGVQEHVLFSSALLTKFIADVNECDTGTPCNTGVCSNTEGSFTCDCTGTAFAGPTCSDGEY